MFKIGLSLLFILHVLVLFSQEKKAKLAIQQLTDSCYLFTTYNEFDGVLFPSNGLYVVGDTAVLIVDTPWDKEQLLPLLDTIYSRHHKRVRFCISTHFHDDRTQGLEEYKKHGILTYSSALTKKWCIERKMNQAEFTFANDTVFKLFGIDFETFYPGKGHTEDNIILYFPKQKLLYGGCFIKSIENHSLGFIGDADVKEWKKSLQKTINKYEKITTIVVPGHFACSDAKALSHSLKLIKKRK